MKRARDFWVFCGHHLLDRDGRGRLRITDEFLQAYLARPELAPPDEACATERELHAALLADPRLPVPPLRIAAIADADARENWEVMIAWRDHLATHETLEAAYLAIIRGGLKFPHLFISQMTQIILRNILDGCDDAFQLRAAEMLFRPQTLALHEGALIAADQETLSGLGGRPASPLVSMLGLPREAGIEVLSDANDASYFDHSDLFHTALDVTAGGRGIAALSEVLRRWIAHLLMIDVVIEPLTELREAPLRWYVGLDAEGTRIGDALWRGEDLDETSGAQVVALYRLTFADPCAVVETLRGEPIYLISAMAGDKVLRLKPQNLIVGLPVAPFERLS